MMKIQFLGTAAYEGIPSLFCGCETCRQARLLGGKNLRTRASVLIDEVLKIDFPPDTWYHSLRFGLELDRIQDLLLTHSHSDHLYAEDMAIRAEGYAKSANTPIHVYGNDLTLRLCSKHLAGLRHHYVFHRVRLFDTYNTETATITPLPASHDPMETCLIYYIEKDGKAILYGHDSGWFPEETWSWLKTRQLDLAILECTVGRSPHRTNHMNIEAVIDTKLWLEANQVLKADGLIVVTHFSHNAGLLHEEWLEIFEPHGIHVAYDGMMIKL
ncbi:MBL fold metallo-hydrolase [Paenibacillus sp. GD4]|jgi:phosphoribosyl 1,2-cyclic phosphate phosphodiesterase|uniref:MBL fold metallo-hydrolase n=1 Tax=Paenibacillus sp. GD4 TaxID=3068890 RepID=UPI0027968A97|nr:MBL fold metallo-hydrolase [Paenibacillus sp. GD4]MDQ1914196.1 MBL fold metallo-hydrolase [Paenibacillus sp. GD4]